MYTFFSSLQCGEARAPKKKKKKNVGKKGKRKEMSEIKKTVQWWCKRSYIKFFFGLALQIFIKKKLYVIFMWGFFMSSHLIFVIGGSKMGIDFYVAALFRFFSSLPSSLPSSRFLSIFSHPFANTNLKLFFSFSLPFLSFIRNREREREREHKKTINEEKKRMKFFFYGLKFSFFISDAL